MPQGLGLELKTVVPFIIQRMFQMENPFTSSWILCLEREAKRTWMRISEKLNTDRISFKQIKFGSLKKEIDQLLQEKKVLQLLTSLYRLNSISKWRLNFFYVEEFCLLFDQEEDV